MITANKTAFMPSFNYFKEQSSNQHKERMKRNFYERNKMLKEIIITIIIFYAKLKSPSADSKEMNYCDIIFFIL